MKGLLPEYLNIFWKVVKFNFDHFILQRLCFSLPYQMS